jgi:hypothetical protein
MIRTFVGFFLACLVVIVAVGCNGSGSIEDRIVDRIRSLLTAANREDIADTMRNYSLDYCDDVDFCGGGTYQDERDCWVNTFNDPTTFVRFSDLRVIDVQVNQQQNEGYIDATVHFIVYDQFGGFIGEDDYSFRMFMRLEGGQWLMWGDGGCFDSPRSAPKSWKDRIGKETKAGGPTTRGRVSVPRR